ncbi:MAG TPA: class I SAM-dependent methyltransferase [Pseudonocardiaceae bacterium]|nr:class I SAM-dependent methyltransferase [Pseudonocardiaceae bacterium]
MPVDFGRTAGDYARYRTAFPAELFTRLADRGIGVAGQRIVDIGTGTGAVAGVFSAAGCHVTGVDVAPEMLVEARRQDPVGTYVVASGEDTGLPGGGWDVVTAAQCWHWLDHGRATAEAHRLLVPGGALAILYRDYVVEPDNVCAVSEELVLRHNPTWPVAGTDFHGREWSRELAAAGFPDTESFDFTVDVPFTHEAWRGRMRSSNGVGATLSDERVAAFDAELAAILAQRFPEPLTVPHHIWAIIARRA